MFDGLLGTAIASKWDKSVVGQVTVTLTLEYLRMIQVERRVRGKRKAIRMLTRSRLQRAWCSMKQTSFVPPSVAGCIRFSVYTPKTIFAPRSPNLSIGSQKRPKNKVRPPNAPRVQLCMIGRDSAGNNALDPPK